MAQSSETKTPRVELARVRGGFIGLALGDALGAPHEFRNSKAVYTGKLEHSWTHKTNPFMKARKFAAGSTSDDTDMSLTLARSLIRKQGYNRKDVALSYIAWANSGTVMIGKNTRELLKVAANTKGDPGGLKHYEKKFIEKFAVYPEYPFSATSETAEAAQSNGALMRCFPLACLWDATAVQKDVWMTNPSRVAFDAENVQVTCLRLALMGTPAKDIWTQAQATPFTEEVKAVFKAILGGENWTLADEGEGKDRVRKKGWVVNSLYASMACLAALAAPVPEGGKAPSYGDLMAWVIGSHPGSDTDTNAAIAGGLIGAIVGWDELLKDPITLQNIQTLVTSVSEPEHPRPAEYTLADVESVVQGLTALSALDPSAEGVATPAKKPMSAKRRK